MTPAPQEKTGFSQTQNPQVEEARKQIALMMQETGLKPEQLKDLGNAAEVAIYNKELYPIFVQKARQYRVADEEDFMGAPDYQALAIFATMGKLV